MFIGSIRNQDKARKLGIASLNFEQMESGYITPIMSSETSITYQQWAPSTWVGSIKKFVFTMDAEIQIPNTHYPQAQQEFDVSLIETFQLKYTGTKILAQLNRCQVWLRVITLSNVTDASGHALCPYAASCLRHPQRPYAYTWRVKGKSVHIFVQLIFFVNIF